MLRTLLLAAALTLALPAHAESAPPALTYTCLDGSGQKVISSHPCNQAPADVKLNAPAWLWPVVGLLGVLWIISFLPDRMFGHRGIARMSFRALIPEPEPEPEPAATAAPPKPRGPPAWSVDILRDLDSGRLSTLVKQFWEARAFSVQLARHGDGSVDLLISRPGTDKPFAVAQCQGFRAPGIAPARVAALQRLAQERGATLGLLYGFSGFAPEALELARGKPLKLIKAEDLLAEIVALKPDQQRALMAKVA